MSKTNKVKYQKSIKVKCQMSKINKVNFDGAYLGSSSGHFLISKISKVICFTRVINRCYKRMKVIVFCNSTLPVCTI